MSQYELTDGKVSSHPLTDSVYYSYNPLLVIIDVAESPW